MSSTKCKVENCAEPVYGALHIPVYKDGTGVEVNGKYIPLVIEEYELWYYCRDHYEINSMVDQMIDNIIEGIRGSVTKVT